MAIITLTTDLGQTDAYVGSVKGKLISKCPSATLVDISHHIPRFNIFHAAYVIRNAFPDFPEGTIHVIGVESTEAQDARAVAISYQGQFFIGFDNGLLSLICKGQPDGMVMLDGSALDHQTFLLRDLLAEAACELANGIPLEKLGRPVQGLTEGHTQEPVLVDHSIRGNVVYIDHYGNAITNISEELFRDRGNDRPFQLNFKRDEVLTRISKGYNDVPEGEKLCIFNAAGYLEIAINKGQANRLIGLQLGDIVQVDFET